MKPGNLREEVQIELESLANTLRELSQLLADFSSTEPATREVAAAGLFLANFYGGIENILKRVCRFHGACVPSGASWHAELVRLFSSPPRPDFPGLIDAALATDLAPYRRFRHVVHHGYGVLLRWDDMLPGIQQAPEVFGRFKAAISQYLDGLPCE